MSAPAPGDESVRNHGSALKSTTEGRRSGPTDADLRSRALRYRRPCQNHQVLAGLQLSEKALPGFVDEARKRSKQEPEHQFYWEAVALEGERQRELQRLRRTGKGEWVAVVQLFRHTGASSVEEALIEHASCNGEAAAIAKMKELIQKHYEKAGPGISIEARTMPTMEWEINNGPLL